MNTTEGKLAKHEGSVRDGARVSAPAYPGEKMNG